MTGMVRPALGHAGVTSRTPPTRHGFLHRAPTAGVPVTADFEFDVPVRFDTDHMAVTIETFRLHRWQQIPIVEIRS